MSSPRSNGLGTLLFLALGGLVWVSAYCWTRMRQRTGSALWSTLAVALCWYTGYLMLTGPRRTSPEVVNAVAHRLLSAPVAIDCLAEARVIQTTIDTNNRLLGRTADGSEVDNLAHTIALASLRTGKPPAGIDCTSALARLKGMAQ